MIRNYCRFFSIDVGHEYFLNRKCPDLEIIPAADTLTLFKRLNMLWRQTENQFLTLISENEAHEPFFNVPPHKYYRVDYGKTCFRLYVTVKNPLFLNYTNLNSNPRKIFYFSNLANNAEKIFLYLTTPIPEFENGKEYLPGNQVRDVKTGQVYEANKKLVSKKKNELQDTVLWAPKGLNFLPAGVQEFSLGKLYQVGDLVKEPKSEDIYEAARKHTSASEAQLKDAGSWTHRGQGQLQYPTPDDVMDYSNGAFTFTLPEPTKKVEITILGFNYHATEPAYDVPMATTETETFEQPVDQISIKLAHLKPGKYQIKINKESAFVYYDPVLQAGKVLGIIEIFNHLTGNNPYALLTDEEKIKKINYNILFPTRRVLWKYIRKDNRAQTITDSGLTGYQFHLAGDDFISTVPIPLSEGVIKTLKLEFNTADFKLSPLPNPAVQRFSKCTQDDYDYICSEMYLNY